MHITAATSAREILSDGQLQARMCPALGLELLYFFALRPAYGKKTDNEKHDQVGRFPAVFIVDPEKLGVPYHVFPFDTGGALAGVFGDTPNPGIFFEDYELAPSLDAIGAHIEWAFENRGRYFAGEVRSTLPDSLPQFDEVGRSYVAIARLTSSAKKAPDHRASSIEAAYKRHISLSDHCPLIVIPKQYLEDGPFRNQPFLDDLAQHGVDFRTYDWQPNYCPSDYREILARIVREYLSDEGVLND